MSSRELCCHSEIPELCQECKDEGEEFRRKVRAGELPCPICDTDGAFMGHLSLPAKMILVHIDTLNSLSKTLIDKNQALEVRVAAIESGMRDA